jgi:hypothetical protein
VNEGGPGPLGGCTLKEDSYKKGIYLNERNPQYTKFGAHALHCKRETELS